MHKLNRSCLSLLSLLVLLLCSNTGFSQVIVSGRIITTENTPVQGATVSIQDDKENIIKFAITDNLGKFSLKLTGTLPNYRLIVRSMGFGSFTKTIENKSQDIPIILKHEITQLKEVTVKNNNPIRKKGDTLSYIVESFADQKDRSIADVLAKMPGIEVQEDGKVLYMGKPIQKFYIEGLDLLEGRYNLANNNLPHQSVSSVQVIENHQPIRILDSLVSSDRASINIKLKNKITATGMAKLGIGFSPLLWTANITPMLFTKKRQVLFSYQANNTGNDVSKELKVHTLQELMENLDNPTDKRDLLSIVPVQLPNIASNRYLNNNIHIISANHISKLKKAAELRWNIAYVNDNQLQEGENLTTYLLPTNNVNVVEKISNRIFANDLQSNLALEKNTPNIYLKNSLKAQINWEGQRGVALNNGVPIVQQLRNPFYSFSNQLKAIKKFHKQLVTIYSLLNYNKTPQELSVLPGQFAEVLNNNNPYEQLQQQITASVWQTNNYVEFTKGIGLFTFTNRAGFSLIKRQTESDILVNATKASEAFQNDQSFTNTNLYINATATFKKHKWELLAKLPLQYNSLSVEDALNTSRQANSGWVVQPMLIARLQMNSFWQSSWSVGYDNSFQNAAQILSGFVLSNYRNLQQQNYPIARVLSSTLSAGLNYRNPIKSIFFNTSFFYSEKKNPFILQSSVLPNGTKTMTVRDIANNSYTYNFGTRLSKYFHRIKTTVALSLDANYQKGNQLLGNVLAKTINQTIRPGLKINTAISKKISADYQLEPIFSHNKTANNAANDIFSLNEQLRLHLYPAANHYISLAAEHYYNDAVSTNQHNIYTDLSYRYTITKKRIDLELRCNNLFNAQRYIKSNFTDFYFSQSIIQIRPRQFLATVGFSF